MRRYNLDNFFITIIILSTAMGNLDARLPMNISQIIVLFYTFFQVIEMLIKKKIIIFRQTIFLIVYTLFFTVVVNHYVTGSSMKMLGGIILYSFCFSFYIWKTKDRIDNIMRILINISIFLAIIGVLQEIGFLLSIKPLYSFEYLGVTNQLSLSGPLLRITSLTTEPAHLGYMLIPGLYMALSNIFGSDTKRLIRLWQSIIIFIATFLTFSLITYLNLLIIAPFILLRGKISLLKKIFVGAVFGLIVVFVISFLKDSLQLIVYKYNSFFTLDQLNTTNLSSFAVDSNLRVALANVKDHYFLGSGLDSHKDAYFKYINNYYDNVVMFLNTDDAASLFIRILSEFGFPGLFLFLFFLYKFKIKKRLYHINVQANEMALVFIIGYSLRNGIYIDPFLWIMISLYMATFNEFKKRHIIKQQQAQEGTEFNLI